MVKILDVYLYKLMPLIIFLWKLYIEKSLPIDLFYG